MPSAQTPRQPDPANDTNRRRIPFLEVMQQDNECAIAIHKDGQRLVYPCPPDGEAELLDRVAADARDPGHVLTWFDASLIAHRVGKKLAAQVPPCEDDLINPADHVTPPSRQAGA